jgi:hypothetical protein
MLHKDYDRKCSVGKKKRIAGRESQWTWHQDELTLTLTLGLSVSSYMSRRKPYHSFKEMSCCNHQGEKTEGNEQQTSEQSLLLPTCLSSLPFHPEDGDIRLSVTSAKLLLYSVTFEQNIYMFPCNR